MRTNLKLLRVKNHLTQDQMACECGVSRCTYAGIESGRVRGADKFWTALQNRFGVADAEMWELTKDETI